METYIDIPGQKFSLFGQGSRMSGTFKLLGHTRLWSHIEGEIQMQDDSDLCIESEGRVEGTIVCGNLEIYGEVKGEIRSSGKLVIYPTARVQGQIQAANMVIHPGALVNMDGHTLQ